ncbi:hypothetical protein FLAG1_03373 [Fusarium langsethiae]|uniref:Uncharacterized protein n=1 Tax=Fusarium langsethiae TaxID=179993 RepID=A0A0N0DG95_FUSLA|nr:hypothetical protein FLAG1_03373 [Fusarium langsethiae]GKU01303.1 unnamed protein product [Fusarium langsethiae]GKU22369.1 unnamed protein product [Fusarium langsethiae]
MNTQLHQAHREQSVYYFDGPDELKMVIQKNVEYYVRNCFMDQVQKAKDVFKDVKRLLPGTKEKEKHKKQKEIDEFCRNTDDHNHLDDDAGNH